MDNRGIKKFWKWNVQMSVLLFMAALMGALRVAGQVGNMAGAEDGNACVVDVVRINPAAVEIIYGNGCRLTVDFYGANIFRLFRDDAGGVLRDPEAEPEAPIAAEAFEPRPVAPLEAPYFAR